MPHGTRVAEGKLPIGYCADDRQVSLLEESARDVADGEVGEIAVTSRYLSSGYWRDPHRTRAVFLPNAADRDLQTYLTGDLGRRLSDGALVHVGRRDSQVKVRGFRVEVSEIESALCAVKGIREAVVVARETAPGETRLVAYFVESGSEPVLARALRDQLAQTLPDYMVPSVFMPVSAIPQTPSGKTDHQRLPPIPVRSDVDGSSRGPRNEIEVDLATIWSEILGVEQLGIDDDFLHLGGDSLKAAQIAARVADRFKCDVPASAALRLETVAKMAEVVAVVTHGHSTADRAWPA